MLQIIFNFILQFGGPVALGVAFGWALAYLIMKQKRIEEVLKDIKEQLSNHITGTEKKIDQSRQELKTEAYATTARMANTEKKIDQNRRELKEEIRESIARLEDSQKENTARLEDSQKENTARLEDSQKEIRSDIKKILEKLSK